MDLDTHLKNKRVIDSAKIIFVCIVMLGLTIVAWALWHEIPSFVPHSVSCNCTKQAGEEYKRGYFDGYEFLYGELNSLMDECRIHVEKNCY